ncbi:unnamed protein product [Ambrosiozyma monospora]|uniref:Unnamed protein product n=1 Tax=Ambrosiozyma monospora TaxID=43982 RepID=A0A9W6YZ41_AMBMO|nr:unnamed protein product [Ambrosiozyma monospora]
MDSSTMLNNYMNLQPTMGIPGIHIINIIERSTTANQQLIFPSFFHLLFSTLQHRYGISSVQVSQYPRYPHHRTIHHHKSTANFPQLFPFTIFNTPIHGRYFQCASINIFNWVKMVDYQLELDKVDLIATSHQVYSLISMSYGPWTLNGAIWFPYPSSLTNIDISRGGPIKLCIYNNNSITYLPT